LKKFGVIGQMMPGKKHRRRLSISSRFDCCVVAIDNVLAYGEHERLLGAGVRLQRCGYFISLCDCVETVLDSATDVGATDQRETNVDAAAPLLLGEEVDESTACARGEAPRRRNARGRAANRRRPRIGNWQGYRAEYASDTHYPGDQEAGTHGRRGPGPVACRGFRQYRGQAQRYRGQGRGMTFDTVSTAADDQQSYYGDDAQRGAVGGRRSSGQYRGGGRYTRPSQDGQRTSGGWSYQNVSSDSGEVEQHPANRRGYRARGRDGFQSSVPSYHGPAYNPASHDTSQWSHARGGPPYRGRGSHPHFHGSVESLDDDAGADAKNRRVVDVPNEVGSEKCHVLIFQIGDLRQLGCRVFVDTRNHQVMVSAGGAASSQEALDKTVELVLRRLVEMQTIR